MVDRPRVQPGRASPLGGKADGSRYDVVVVGGGITGAGVARDLARRGLSVLLLEKNDWGGATTGASSWLLHGGARYLAYDWKTTRLSCIDTGRILDIARHLVHRVVMLLPTLRGDRHGIEQMEAAMEVYDRLQPLKKSRPHARLTRDESRQLEPGLSPDVIGTVTMEEWGVDPHRLTWLNVVDAIAGGATALNHACVERIETAGGSVKAVTYRRDGAAHRVSARAVVNATGPWSPVVAGLAGATLQLRPTKGVHIVYDRRLSNFGISAEAIDGRSLLMVPMGAFTLLGTTDDDFYGSLDQQEVLPEEIDYLLQGFERVFPGIREYHRVRATSGVRPTLYRWRPNEDVLSREHHVFDHADAGAAGLVTITGGKLAMYRLMAEEAADAVCRRLGVSAASDTAAVPLPGNDHDLDPPDELAREFGLTALAIARLQTRHGSGAAQVLRAAPSLRAACRCDPVSESELTFAARHEQVSTLADALRRVGLASGPCGGARCVEMAAAIVGRELDWSASQRADAADDFRRALWRTRVPVIDSVGWAEEELIRGARGGQRA